MRIAATKLSYEKLHEMLGLSEDVHIDDIFSNTDDRYMRTFHLVLSGQSPVIPEHQEGSQLATNPLYHYQRVTPLYSLGQGYSGGLGRMPDRQGFFQGLLRYV